MPGGRGNAGKREHKPIPEEGPYRAFVGNLPFDTIYGDFDTLFAGLTIKHIQMMRDRETDQFKGFAYVEFASKEELTKAMEIDGAEFDRRIVRVDVADDRSKQRNRSPKNARRGRGGDHNRGGKTQNEMPRPNDSQIKSEQSRRISETNGNDQASGASGDESFQVVPSRKSRGNRNNRGNDRPQNNNKPRGSSFQKARGTPVKREEKPVTGPPVPDPSRPKLNLKPRTTDPIELERLRIKDEEERQARLEKIYKAK